MIGCCIRASCRAPAGSPGPDDRTLTVRFCLCCKPRIHQTLFHPSLQRPLSHPATNAGFYHQPAARSNRILGNESSEKMNCCHCADAVCWWRWPSLTLMVYRSNIWVSWNQARGCGPLSNYANTCCVSEAHPAQPELFRLFSSSLPVHHTALWPEALSSHSDSGLEFSRSYMSPRTLCTLPRSIVVVYGDREAATLRFTPFSSSCLRDFHVSATHSSNLDTLDSTG